MRQEASSSLIPSGRSGLRSDWVIGIGWRRYDEPSGEYDAPKQSEERTAGSDPFRSRELGEEQMGPAVDKDDDGDYPEQNRKDFLPVSDRQREADKERAASDTHTDQREGYTLITGRYQPELVTYRADEPEGYPAGD